ncbi:hypothetical protein HDU83_002724 [Entophlyctis luteolus]|nr:hypothetical protein HDU83_002724 [Entophlyctis luteolus]
MVDPNDVTAMTPLKLTVADTAKESTRSLLTVVLARRGEIVDEISVEVGDQVEILQEFDDGWAKGRLNTTACAPWAYLFLNVSSLAADSATGSIYGLEPTVDSWSSVVKSARQKPVNAFNVTCANQSALHIDGLRSKLRYLHSVVCFRDLLVLSGGCNSFSSLNAPLCTQVFVSFTASLKAAMEEYQCTEVDDGLIERLFRVQDGIKLSTAWGTENKSTCLLGLAEDSKRCGFSSAAEAFRFCSQISDSCCKSSWDFSNALDFAKNLTAQTETFNFDLFLPITIAKICVGLVVFAGFAVIAILNQRRQNRASLSSDLPMLRLDLPANYGAFGFSARSSHNGEAARDGLAMTSEPTDSARLSNDTEIPLLVARQAGSVRSGTVARLYRPARTDELRLRLQQRVDMLEEFADGWAKGRVYVAGGDSVVGVFPIDCVEFDE